MTVLRVMAAVLVALCLLGPPARSQGMLGVGISDSQVDPKGAFVGTVEPGSPAAAAGIVPGDVITGIDGAPITGAAQLQQIVAGHAAGAALRLRVAHYGGASTEIAVTLGGTAAAGTPPSATPAASNSPGAPAAGGKQARPDLTWTRYADPVEHAFTIDVPAGWRVTGGTRRMSAISASASRPSRRMG